MAKQMALHEHLRAFATAIALLLLFLSPCVAELDAQPTEAVLDQRVDLAAPVTVDAGCTHREGMLVCGNVWVSAALMPAFVVTLAGSATFRRQLAALNRAPLHVAVLGPDYQSPILDYDAATELRIFSDGFAMAKVRIRVRRDVSGLLGHEFEHLCEWADGALAQQSLVKSRFVVDSYRVAQAGKLVLFEVVRHQERTVLASRQ